jgi:hypothetical protein
MKLRPLTILTKSSREKNPIEIARDMEYLLLII